MSYVTKNELNKKLCIHCEHCIVYSGLFMKDRKMCDLHKFKTDDSEKYSILIARYNPWICGGRKWEQDSSIIECDTEEEVRHFRSEDWIKEFIPRAREIVENNETITISCGGLDEAIKRVKKEMTNSK